MSANGRDIKKATRDASKEVKRPNPYSKDAIVSWLGQFMYPGQITHIPSNQITMQGIPYPVKGVDNTGFEQMMYPGMNYTFPGTSVTEYPQTIKDFEKDWARRERWSTSPDNPANKMTRKQIEDAWINAERQFTNPENFPKGNYELYKLLSNYATGGPSVEKAKAMLEDGTAWGHPLTQKQIDLFRSIVEEAEGESEDTGEEYRRGGQKRRRLPHNRTSQNIKTSLNFLMTRNPILYGRYPHALYDPNAKMEFGGWLDKYQGDVNGSQVPLRAATTYQEAHQNPVQYEKKVNARVKHIDDKLKTSDKPFVIYDGALYSNPYADPERNEFIMPDTHGGYTSSGITPFDLMLPVQSVAAAKGAVPLLQKVKTSDVKALAKTYGKKVAKELKDVANAAKAVGEDMVNTVDNTLVTPIQFRKEIKEIKELAKKQPEVFNNPVTQAKLEELGIDPKLLQLNPKQFESLSFNSGSGSAYYPWADHINIDMRQINKLKKQGYNLSPKAVYEHELGHKIQQKNYLSNRDVLKELLDNDSPEGRIKVLMGKQSKPTKLDDLLANELKLSVELGENNPTALRSWDYYTHSPVERLAHLREMRQGMIDKGIIKDQFQPITKGHIKTYAESTPNDRIVSFMNKEDVENYSKLRDAFKLLPAAVPIGLGVGAAGNKKYGGWLDQYGDGGGNDGEKPWGEMSYAEKKAYLDTKEKKKPMTKAQADAWAKKAQQKSSAQAKKEHYEDFVRESTAKTLTHPLFTAPAYFTPEGAAIGVLQSMANLPGHIKDKDYVGIGMDVLGALPGAPKTIQKTVQKTAPYAKHFAEDLPHYLPKVNLQKGKPLITFPEYENYWRVQPHGFSREKIPYNPELTLEQNLYTGRWVETDPVGALDYVKGVQKKVGPGVDPRFDVIKGRMPKTRLEQLRGHNLPEQAKLMSYGPGKYGTWDVAYNEGAITDIEKNILTMYERHPELFTEGSLHKGHYDNVVRKIAANPDLIKTSEAILPAEKIRLANMFLKKKGLSTSQAEDLLRKAAEPQPSFLGKYKKYSPFEQGGSTGGWLDNYE